MQGQNSPFHTGEQMLQLRAGVRDEVERSGAGCIQSTLSSEAITALESAKVAFAGFVDHEGAPVCIATTGTPGFLSAPASGRLELRYAACGDVLERALTAGSAIALMVPGMGGRLRVSGRVDSIEPDRLRIGIAQTYRNDARYMHLRNEEHPLSSLPELGEVLVRHALSADMMGLLRWADTLVLATRHPDLQPDGKHGLDVSLRSGLPGFLEVPDDGTLLWPEYPGNNFFNTLGNLMLDARCCVLVSAGGSERALRIRGRAEVLWRDPELKALFGAERGVRLRIEQAAFIADKLNAVAPLLSYAPDLAGTSRRGPAPPPWRPLRVVGKTSEAEDLVSVDLAPAGPVPLLPYLAGQHLALRIPIASGEEGIERHYSISRYERTPQRYRLTIRRGCADGATTRGTGSTRIHDHIEVGSILVASAPTGDFTLPDELPRTPVLVSAGIGIAPMLAMLQALADRHPQQPVWFIHGTRNSATLPFRQEINALRERLPNATWHIQFSSPLASDVLGEGFDRRGRIGLHTLKSILPFDGYDFYLCGPDDFLADLHSGLRDLGVPPSQIHLESFGMDGRARTGHEVPLDRVLPVRRAVRFAKSGVTVHWQSGAGSLLDLALRAGIDAPFSCRTGMCGTCSQRLLTGRIAYQRKVTAKPDVDRILLCSALPASDLEIDL